MEWEEYDYFGSRRSTYTLLQLSVLAFILMVQPYEVEAVDDWREGEEGTLQFFKASRHWTVGP